MPSRCALADVRSNPTCDSTGPLFIKYNGVLRGSGVGHQLCKENQYTTTLHAISSCIVKLSKLTAATRVYRGVAGADLPQTFWQPNEHGVRGGIEAAFMSTTLDRDVAFQYASRPNKPAIVFEVHQGMVDRGADISWLSQRVLRDPNLHII